MSYTNTNVFNDNSVCNCSRGNSVNYERAFNNENCWNKEFPRAASPSFMLTA